MQKKSIMVCLLLMAAALLVCGCTEEGSSAGETPVATPEPTETTEAPVGQPAPTPPGDWGGTEPYEVGFVDPATYHLPTPEPTVTLTRPPDDLNVEYSTGGIGSDAVPSMMKPYANFSAERPSGVMASAIYHVPFPYWALNYTVEAYNSEYSRFSVEIMDANDPNREVGGIKLSGPDFINNASESESNFTRTDTLLLREGFRDYYLVVEPSGLKSFSITILAPAKYMI